MTKIEIIEHRKRFISNCGVFSIIFSPLWLKLVWRALFLNHDYFSVSQMPFSKHLLTTYGFFNTSAAFYYIIFAGTLALASLYFLKSKRFSSVIRYLGRGFSQVRVKI